MTGAASGIGPALARWCAREGMQVVLADVEAAAVAHRLFVAIGERQFCSTIASGEEPAILQRCEGLVAGRNLRLQM